MVFPIAVGTGPRHSSSRPFPPTISRGSQNDEQYGYGRSGDQDDDVIMAIGTNDDETLTSTVFISYQFLAINNSSGNAATRNYANDYDINSNEGPDDDSSSKDPLPGDLSLNETHSDAQFNVIAELRVQITPTTSPFVSSMDAMSSRETKSRVPLGIMRKRTSHIKNSTSYAVNASVEFSSNESHLACLVPLPIGYGLFSSESSHDRKISTSTIVIFRIRAQYVAIQQRMQQHKQHNLPKLPEYIVEKTINSDRNQEELDKHTVEMNNYSGLTSGMLPHRDSHGASSTTSPSAKANYVSHVAHEPKIVRVPHLKDDCSAAMPNRSFLRKLSGNSSSPAQQAPLQCATCMCNVPSDHYRGKTSSALSLLMVGTTDGRLILVDYLVARVCSVALDPISDSHKEENNSREYFNGEENQQGKTPGYFSNTIVHLNVCTPTQWKPHDIYGEEQGSESKGRIATVYRDGSVNIYTTSFVVPTARVENVTRGKKANGANRTGLEMRIKMLSTFHSSKKSRSRVCYVRAQWMNPLLLVLLTRSSCLDEDFLLQQSNSAITSQSETVVAHVWTVAEVMNTNQEDKKESNCEANGWTTPPDVYAVIALASELKMPCGDGFDEFVHDTFSISQDHMVPMNDLSVRDSFLACTRCMSIAYHRVSDSVAINSQVVTHDVRVASIKVRPFCLIWDWKCNVPGLTLASSTDYCLYQPQNIGVSMNTVPSLYSWFLLGEDDDYGLCAVHVYVDHQKLSGKRRAGKHIFTLSTLSPLNRLPSEGHLSLNEPSAILLHRDSVTFPFLGRPSSTLDTPLQWEEARVPPTYVASNGPCQTAAVGKYYGRSIAVASSCGVCVLDLSRMSELEAPRWKLFSNINDEQRFSVSHMTWWERVNEDYLLAVVQFTNIDTLHLVCWSRKSLGFEESQLLRESTTCSSREGDGVGAESNYGVALPSGFRVHSMSIINDPADALPSGRSPSSRALLLLAYISCREGTIGCMQYTVYQLQARQSNRKHELVLARNSAYGRIPLQLGRSPDFSATDSVTGVFLAGGSFLFDLNTMAKDQAAHDVIAVIGVVTIFQGLIAVCVNKTGPILYRPSLLQNTSIDECRVGGMNSLIVTYWLSGTISIRSGCRVAWSIAKNDGSVYCWSVPCRNMQSSHRGDQHAELLQGHSILGEIFHLGSSSLWMNGAMTNEREIALGPFCSNLTLYAGQRSRKNSSLSNAVAVNSFHVSNCVVTPPQFTPFLFVLLLSLSANKDCKLQLDTEKELSRKLTREYIKATLRQMKSFGSCSSALRIVALKVIELLNNYKAVDGCPGSGYISGEITQGKVILCEIVSMSKEIYDTLGFSTLFLSVGRQLEPHQFNLIFPLPESHAASSPSLCTVDDFFSVSCYRGSLATALSALPLFSCHNESQQSVTKLIYHCLIKIEENFRSCSSHTAITSSEDEAFLHQLFWFGVKLEDAIEVENSYAVEDKLFRTSDSEKEDDESIDSNQSSSISSSTESYDESSIDQDTADLLSVSASVESYTVDYSLETLPFEDEQSRDLSFLSPCLTPRKPRVGLVKKVAEKLFPEKGPPVETDSLEECAIHEAASSFILSGFDDLSLQNTPCAPLPTEQHKNDETLELKPAEDNPTYSLEASSCYASVPTTVAGAVCLFIEHAIAFNGADGWKAVSAVAHLLQGDRETPAITSASSANAQSITQVLTIQDFLAAAAAATPTNGLFEKEDSCDIISLLLVDLTHNCCKYLNKQAFGNIFNLILLLLLRYDTCHDVHMCRATLITTGIVSGHLSGRISELLDFSERPNDDLCAIYYSYAAKLKNDPCG